MEHCPYVPPAAIVAYYTFTERMDDPPELTWATPEYLFWLSRSGKSVDSTYLPGLTHLFTSVEREVGDVGMTPADALHRALFARAHAPDDYVLSRQHQRACEEGEKRSGERQRRTDEVLNRFSEDMDTIQFGALHSILDRDQLVTTSLERNRADKGAALPSATPTLIALWPASSISKSST